jgi:integrase
MNLDLSQLGAAEQAQLSALLAKLQPSAEPVKKRVKPRRGEKIKYLSEQQVEAFFRVIQSPRDIAIFRLAYHRGLRASEIGALQLADYNVRDDRITFTRRRARRASPRGVKLLTEGLRMPSSASPHYAVWASKVLEMVGDDVRKVEDADVK